MESLATIAGRIAILVGVLTIIAGWREEPKTPRQPVPFKPYPIQIKKSPTQVRPPDPIPTKPETVSVLAKPDIPFVTGICPPVRKPIPQKCEILTDLYCRLENPHYWADPTEPGDLVTWAHEMAHGASNRLHASTIKHGIYLGNGKGVVLKHPKVTIEQVANSVPKDQRGPIFKLYMVEQRKDWNTSPAYLLDEWNAYIVGTIARKQLGWDKRKETEDFAREMERYCRVMLAVVQKRDPEYPDLQHLKNFINWQSERFDQIVKGNDK
jgi:hypothetical protein